MIAPCAAELTVAAYLAITPRLIGWLRGLVFRYPPGDLLI